MVHMLSRARVFLDTIRVVSYDIRHVYVASFSGIVDLIGENGCANKDYTLQQIAGCSTVLERR